MFKIGLTQILQLSNDKFAGFHWDTAQAAKLINIPGFDTITAQYELDINNFNDYTNGQDATIALGVASIARKKRDQALMQLRNCAKQWSSDADQGKQALGSAIWNYFKNFTRVDHMRSDVVTQKVDSKLPLVRNLVASEPYAPLYRGSIIEESLSRLEDTESAYAKANETLATKQNAREQLSNADLRDSCMDKFFKIKVAAEIIAEYRGDKECVDFLEELQRIQQKYLAVKAA